ncbi:phospholipase-like protein [Tanacetum coccineum]
MVNGTVFGRWLDITSNPNDNHLINYVLQHQVYVPQPSIDCPPMVFKIGGHELKFGRNEFCLVTGFRCGHLSKTHSEKSPFCDRVLPEKKLKNVKGKELMAIINDETVWAKLDDTDADSIPILELTPTDKELKETWLIGSLSYIRGEDVSFIQSVSAVEYVDQAVAIDDHILTCLTDSNTLLEDVDSLFKEILDVRPDLVGRVGELRTKIVQTLASTVSTNETVVSNSFDVSLKPDDSNRDEINFFYQESQQGSLQHLVMAME